MTKTTDTDTESWTKPKGDSLVATIWMFVVTGVILSLLVVIVLTSTSSVNRYRTWEDKCYSQGGFVLKTGGWRTNVGNLCVGNDRKILDQYHGAE